jgi:hypothetical protein
MQLSCEFLFGGVIPKPGALQPGEASRAWLNCIQQPFEFVTDEYHVGDTRQIPRPAGEKAPRDDAFTEKQVEVVAAKNIVTAASSSPAASIDQTPLP